MHSGRTRDALGRTHEAPRQCLRLADRRRSTQATQPRTPDRGAEASIGEAMNERAPLERTTRTEGSGLVQGQPRLGLLVVQPPDRGRRLLRRPHCAEVRATRPHLGPEQLAAGTPEVAPGVRLPWEHRPRQRQAQASTQAGSSDAGMVMTGPGWVDPVGDFMSTRRSERLSTSHDFPPPTPGRGSRRSAPLPAAPRRLPNPPAMGGGGS